MQLQRYDDEKNKYRLPGFEMRLLQELQRQQNHTLFCDTLLQTDGVSIPVHGSVLAAFSPYLSKRLSNSPIPPAGQQRQIQLRTVKAHTLVKLVGFMYSGELEVSGTAEHRDILAGACQLGVGHLLENVTGLSDGLTKQPGSSSRSWENSGIPTEGWGGKEGGDGRNVEVLVGMEGRKDAVGEFAASETQIVDRLLTHVGEVELPAASALSTSVAESFRPPKDVALFNMCSPTTCPGGTAGKPYDVHTGSRPAMFSPHAASKEPPRNGPKPLDGLPCSLLSEITDKMVELSGGGLTAASSHSTVKGKHPTPAVEETTGIEAENLATNGNIEMVGAAQISIKPGFCKREQEQSGADRATQYLFPNIGEHPPSLAKVKLRRSEGEVWEVVSIPDAERDIYLSKDNEKLIRLQTEATADQPIPTVTHHAQSPYSSSPAPPTDPPTLPKPPLHQDSTPDFELFSNNLCTPNHSADAQIAQVSLPQGSVEDSDEHIDKLLEDIMVGLRILPATSLERDYSRSSQSQPAYEGTPATFLNSICSSDFFSATTTACRRPESYLDCSPQSKCPHCCFSQHSNRVAHELTICASEPNCISTQSQTRCTSSLSVRSMARFNQDHQSSALCNSLKNMQHRIGGRCQTTLRSESQDCLYLEEARRMSETSTDLYSSYQQVHCSTGLPRSQEESRAFPELSRHFDENEIQFSRTISLPCTEDFRLPRCLSPLEPTATVANSQLPLGKYINDEKVNQPNQKSSSLFTEKPKALQFPLGSMNYMEDTTLSQDTFDPPNPYQATRKRKFCNGSKVKCKKSKVIEGRRCQINLSPCSISLSCNNILVNRIDSLARLKKSTVGNIEKTKSDTTETMTCTHSNFGDVLTADKTLITTRSSLRKPGSDASLSSIPEKTVENVEAPKRKRGRPLKKVPNFHKVPSSGSHKEKGGKNMYGRMIEDKPKTKYMKSSESLTGKDTPNLNLSGIGVAPTLQRSSYRERHSQQNKCCDPGGSIIPTRHWIQPTEPKDLGSTANNLTVTKRSSVVTLKKIKELIKHRHSRTSKSVINKKTELSKTENTLNRSKAGDKSDCTIEAFEEKMNIGKFAENDVSGNGKAPHSNVSIAFEKQHNQAIKAEDKRLETHGKKYKCTKGQVEHQRQDQNHNDVPCETNALPTVEKSRAKANKEDNCHLDDAEKVGVLPEIAQLGDHIKQNDIGLQELNRSPIEKVEVDLSIKEIAFNNEETKVSCFVPKDFSRKEVISVSAEEEEHSKMEVCRKRVNYSFQYTNKVWQPDCSKQPASTGQSFAQLCFGSPQEKGTDPSLQTPRRKDCFLESTIPEDSCHNEDDEDEEDDVEVDILQCSSPVGFQAKPSLLQYSIMESSQEEDEEEEGKEIDVTTFEAE